MFTVYEVKTVTQETPLEVLSLHLSIQAETGEWQSSFQSCSTLSIYLVMSLPRSSPN